MKVTVASITCSYEIKCDGRVLVAGKARYPFVNKVLKPVRFPKDIKELLERILDK
ncbi:hypothetical protein AGMMS49990_06530 [Endomicrobiia bacterium]|nr:hypothetical protein AGMMS49990_06530 [Endomicrobiia bacterium]